MSFPFALLSVLCLFALRCQSQSACAVAVLSVVPGGGAGTITGTVKITQPNIGDPFQVDVNIQGLTLPGNGLQGLHIHQFGDLRGFLPNAPAALVGGLAAGPHYDPANTQNHGCADTSDPFTAVHMGDLGNWNRTGGAIVQSKLFKTTQLSLRGTDSILGRMIILHSAQDDCVSQPAGNSGSRIAAGVLGACNVANNAAVAPTDATYGVCVLQGTTSKPGAATGSAGLVSIAEVAGPLIQAQARIVPGDRIEHGFHVHQFGDITDATGNSVGPHLNVDGQVHGLPGVNAARHLGDFGSIKSYDSAGNGYYDFTPTDYTPASSLRLTNFIGRSVIIHETLDHGNEPTCPGSENNGAAGARWFQCVIGVANPDSTLEVVTVPGNVRLDNTWINVPCVTPTEAPTTGPNGNNPGGNNGNNNQPYGLSGGAVVGILIAIFFVMILLTICITCIVLKVCCKR